MGNSWISDEEARWLQSLEMDAVRETARQDGIREAVRERRKAALVKFNLQEIVRFHRRGETIDTIHFVLDQPRHRVWHVLEKLNALDAGFPELVKQDLEVELICYMNSRGRSAQEIAEGLDLSLDVVEVVLEVIRVGEVG